MVAKLKSGSQAIALRKLKSLTARNALDEARQQRIERRGTFAPSAIALLCDKLGITEKEIRQIAVKSQRHNQQAARTFEESVKSSRIDVEHVFRDLGAAVGTESPPVLRDFRSGWLSLPSDDPFRYTQASTNGTGDGHLTSSSRHSEPVAYLWPFDPRVGGRHEFAFSLFVVGRYFICADDGPCEDKYAQVDCIADLRFWQNYNGTAMPLGGGFSQNLFSQKVTNAIVDDQILVAGQYFASTQFAGPGNSYGAGQTFITLRLTLHATASGNGSYASIVLDKTNGGIWCHHIDVGWLGWEP